MSGTTIVTGGTGGLGKAIADQLVAAGRSVVIVARSPNGGQPNSALVGDLARMAETARLAAEASARHPDLDVLINNAGVSKFERVLTADGLETTFATNHMAPFLLSNLLLPILQRNRGVILNITSEQHRWARRIPWEDLQGETRFNPIEQYNLTKLYNVLFTFEMARRVESSGVTVSCVSPGFLRTNLGREARGAFRAFLTLARPFQQRPEVGARVVINALEARASGAYFRGRKQVAPGPLAN